MSKPKKMRELRSIFARPILFLVIMMSLGIFILFNIVLIYTFDSSLSDSLSYISAAMERLYTDVPQQEITLEDLAQTHNHLLNNASKDTLVELIISDNDSNIKYSSANLDYSTIKEILDTSKTHLFHHGKVQRLKVGKDLYYLTKVDIDSQNNVYIFSSTYNFKIILKSTNRTLGSILIGVTILFLVVIYVVAVHLSKPIKKLSNQATDIGNGILFPVTIDSNSIELQTLADNLNIMVKRLKAFNESQKISLQNVSHELRTPLMSIQGYAEGLREGYFDDQKAAANIIIEESKRLSSIVDQILILSRMDTLNQPVHIIPISINDFVEEEVKKLEGYAFREGKHIKTSFSDEKIVVNADYSLLSNIIMNIISNSIRYAKTTIKIDVSTSADKLYIVISDDGCGLNEEDLKYIFTRFYKGKDGNFGLGMSTAKSAAQYMNGDIVAENNESGGAKFIITLQL